jgi:hypothetical protein
VARERWQVKKEKQLRRYEGYVRGDADLAGPAADRDPGKDYGPDVAKRAVAAVASGPSNEGSLPLRRCRPYDLLTSPEKIKEIFELRAKVAAFGGDPELRGYAQLPPLHLLCEDYARKIAIRLREEIHELGERRSAGGGPAR